MTLTHRDQDNLWEKQRHEIEANCVKGDLVIFSTEILSHFLESEIERVKKLIGSIFDDVVIVLYLRRQQEQLVSNYYTHVLWTGVPWTFGKRTPLAYDELIKRWSIFGKDKIRIRLFDKHEFHNNDLLSDFAATVGFDMAGLERIGNLNETTLGSAEIEFLRLLNSHIPKLLDPWTLNPDYQQVRVIRSILLSRQKNPEKMQAYHLNREEARKILMQCQQENDWIAQEYLNRKKLFSEDVSMYPEEVASPHGLTLEKYTEIAAHLFKERCNVIQQLQTEKQKNITEKETCIVEIQRQRDVIQRQRDEIQRQRDEIQHQRDEIQRSFDNLTLLQKKHSIYWHYYRYKVSAKITLGRKRKHYEVKRNVFHDRVRNIRNLCKIK